MIRLLNDVAYHFVYEKIPRKQNLVNLLNHILVKTKDNPIQEDPLDRWLCILSDLTYTSVEEVEEKAKQMK